MSVVLAQNALGLVKPPSSRKHVWLEHTLQDRNQLAKHVKMETIARKRNLSQPCLALQDTSVKPLTLRQHLHPYTSIHSEVKEPQVLRTGPLYSVTKATPAQNQGLSVHTKPRVRLAPTLALARLNARIQMMDSSRNEQLKHKKIALKVISACEAPYIWN